MIPRSARTLPIESKRLMNQEQDRDSKGNSTPGNRARQVNKDKRLAAWAPAQRLMEDLSHPYCEGELNPASALLYLYMTGLMLGVTEEQLALCVS
jgi:hypothetical protein